MVFRRRDKRSVPVILREAVWPRGGWGRAMQYLRHRIYRLPDRPERIARGIFAGVLVSFTPFLGVHVGAAIALAWAIRGNVLAAFLGSFIGNPVTLPFIAVGSVELGRWMLGVDADTPGGAHILATFGRAFGDLRHNFAAIFSDDVSRWGGLHVFFDGIFLPYLVGGLIPGLIVGAICYAIALTFVRAYQARRQAQLRRRLEAIRARISDQQPVGGQP